jgi:hypothetical protein
VSKITEKPEPEPEKPGYEETKNQEPGSGSGLENPKTEYPGFDTLFLPGYQEPGFPYYLIIFIYYYLLVILHLGFMVCLNTCFYYFNVF